MDEPMTKERLGYIEHALQLLVSTYSLGLHNELCMEIHRLCKLTEVLQKGLVEKGLVSKTSVPGKEVS